jgi:glucose-6-phosphate 1-epimerase
MRRSATCDKTPACLMKKHEIPGRVAISSGNGGLLKINVKTDFSTSEIYLDGAHVTGFQKNGEPPLLFMSRESHFVAGQSIRGGVPIIYPWFGQREGAGLHGFARLNKWELNETAATKEGSVKLIFNLPEAASVKAGWPVAKVNFAVTVADKLTMELTVTNPSKEDFTFEDCLHTYFEVGDISRISVAGLKGIHYLDKTDNFARKLESGDAFKISSEVDRVFLNAPGMVEIRDGNLRRKILIEKSGSNSTVVWNPWIAKAKAMPDFGGEEYKQMLCVESGNVAENKITLAHGVSATLKVVLSSQPI